MPNWCENRVEIYAEPEHIKEFVETFMPKGYLDFYKIVPLGLGDDEEGNPVWNYTTAVDKWGTKWQLCEDDCDGHSVDEDRISAYFETAWSPPEGIYNAIDNWFAERDADYSISWFYDEPGMQFAGYLNNE